MFDSAELAKALGDRTDVDTALRRYDRDLFPCSQRQDVAAGKIFDLCLGPDLPGGFV